MVFKHLVEYVVLLTFCWLIRCLPKEISFFLMDRLADFTFFVLRIRVKVVLQNLKTAFNNTKSYQELYDIAHKVYKNFGRTVVETILLPTYSLQKIKSMVNVYNIEYLEDAIKNGKGGILVSAHLGNWELLGTAVLAYGYPISFVVGEQRNKFTDRLLNNYRKKNGIKIIPRQFSLRQVLKVLKNNEFVAILSDQNAGEGGVFVNFFNKPASTPGGAAMFSLKSGAPIIVGLGVPSDDTRKKHNLFFEKIEVNLSGEKEKDIFLLTQEFTKKIEQYVTRFPQHYFWLHKRWKTLPPKKHK